jgi:hypothetical protein
LVSLPTAALLVVEHSSIAARRQGGAAVEDADVIQPQEAAFEYVSPGTVLAIDPPGEVQEQLLETRLEPLSIRPRPARLRWKKSAMPRQWHESKLVENFSGR